ncbi:MAG: glycosyltransferase family 9 protein [Nitrospirota bacterium]|nr:glycosyltransferase family 9 protein [Nitrospirota bacterium]
MKIIPYRNILVIKPGAIGDLLQMTPVFRLLKQAYPDSRITLMVGSAGSADIFLNNPNITEVIIYDRKGLHRSLTGMLSLWKDLRSRKFDLILNFQRSNIRTWLLAAAALPCRILVYHKAEKRTIHAVENYLETIAPLGITTDDIHLDFIVRPEALKIAKSLLHDTTAGTGPIVILNPGASHPVNRWPARKFAELTDLAVSRLQARIVIIGGPGDEELAGKIVTLCKSHPLSLAGKTPLPVLAAVLKQSDILVSGDTGPMHLATAVGAPVIALFGAADPLRTGPVGLRTMVLQAGTPSCIPCRSRSCGNSRHLACMENISAEEVCDSITRMLGKP